MRQTKDRGHRGHWDSDMGTQGHEDRRLRTRRMETRKLLAMEHTDMKDIEMQDKSSRPAIVKDLKDADSYDLIYIGFPVWWYTAPTIINTFIEAYGFKGKTVRFFATSGGSDVAGADKQFQEQYPEINWKPGKLLNGATPEDLAAWVKAK